VVAVATDLVMHEKILSNLAEVKARGATVVAVASDDDDAIEAVADYVLRVPATEPCLVRWSTSCHCRSLPTPWLGDWVATWTVPRNLAKTVTVE